jgi:hypothetical protein
MNENASRQEQIEALRLVEDSGLNATLTLGAQVLITSWFFLRDYMARTGKSFQDIAAADLIDEIKKGSGEPPFFSVAPKT